MSKRLYIALIGDVVRSRELKPGERSTLQAELKTALTKFNETYATAIVSYFVITTGDEFQGLLRDGWHIPDVIWTIGKTLSKADVRFGIGFGRIHTPLQTTAVGMDGPAFHAARSAIIQARKDRRRGGVFHGFGSEWDTILNGLSGLLERQTDRMTRRQREVANLLRTETERASIAEKLGITEQAVSDHVGKMGWYEFADGELALRTALRHRQDIYR